MKLDPALYAAVVTALRELRIARHAAILCGVNPVTAWRIAKREKIELVSLADHHRKRLADPEFRARQIPAARKAASAWLTKMHAKPAFHRESVEAARKNLKHLNRDPAFRAASAERLKLKYTDPDFRQKQAAAASAFQRKRHAQRKKKKMMHELNNCQSTQGVNEC